jgi:ATP-dependent Clp protease adaptor protein ClpS
MSQEEDNNHGDLVVEKAEPKLAKPPLFKVFLVNDDYTPMEFVVEVLQIFFQLDLEQSHQIMLHVHKKGKGVCGVFTREIAETKVALVNQYSRESNHPLMCDMEEA